MAGAAEAATAAPVAADPFKPAIDAMLRADGPPGTGPYLKALVRKPGALPGATALDQARAAGKFTPVHEAWWAAVRKARGDAAGTRALIEVLLLHRSMTHEHVVAGIATALRAGALTPDAVAVEARKAAQDDTTTDDHSASAGPAAPGVRSLT